ncbi:MAG: hypothetical protein Alis3KO_41000 [Aliiglaciecola sp.]
MTPKLQQEKKTFKNSLKVAIEKLHCQTHYTGMKLVERAIYKSPAQGEVEKVLDPTSNQAKFQTCPVCVKKPTRAVGELI